jgi:hypothetical protein
MKYNNKLGKKEEAAKLTLGSYEKAKRKGRLPRTRTFFYYNIYSYRALLAQLNKLGKKVEEANLTLGNFEKAKRKGWLPKMRTFFSYYLTYFLFL